MQRKPSLTIVLAFLFILATVVFAAALALVPIDVFVSF
jgi:hypothetical protein